MALDDFRLVSRVDAGDRFHEGVLRAPSHHSVREISIGIKPVSVRISGVDKTSEDRV